MPTKPPTPPVAEPAQATTDGVTPRDQARLDVDRWPDEGGSIPFEESTLAAAGNRSLSQV
jgi:hypothetical protein